jgi:cell division protein FtsB
MADSREKLEADVMEYCEHFYTTERRYNELMKLLDRQVVITRRECSPEAIDGMLDTIDDLQEQVDKLTAERDELKAKVDDIMDEPDYREAWERMYKECDKFRKLYEIQCAETASRSADYVGEKRKVVELERELEAARAKNRSLKAHIGKMQDGRHVWHERAEALQAKVDSLERKLEECERDREVYRMALGDARLLAHEIARIEAGDAS